MQGVDSAYESLILADPLASQRLSLWKRLRRALTLPGVRRERLSRPALRWRL